MTGNELIRRLRRLGRKHGVEVRFDPQHGKGSHGTIRYGARTATLPQLRKELGKGLLHAVCRELGITPKDLEEV